ncbi:unnamed protein product [Clonostachys byssicola]|uniref:CMP/dCMP-type deaminase domain-containing protein n=1 Tax=Clonostachys byssicola TaxID=160290 RepID=A0A9N9US04_9HYPO|nr:unnamed protein product [Clonostachys byssicola]
MARFKSLLRLDKAGPRIRKLFTRDHGQSATVATAGTLDANLEANANTVNDSHTDAAANKPADILGTQNTQTVVPGTPDRPVTVPGPPKVTESGELENTSTQVTDLQQPALEAGTRDTMRVSVPSPNKKHAPPGTSADLNKENLPIGTAPERQRYPNHAPVHADVDALASSLDGLGLDNTPKINILQETTPVVAPAAPEKDELIAPELSPEELKALQEEQDRHSYFTEEALEMARLALRTNETPVGCVFVHKDKIIARGMNATNVTRNGTRHAEFMALAALLSIPSANLPRTTSLKPKPKVEMKPENMSEDSASTYSAPPDEGNEDGRKGHLYPYGQKEHPDAKVDRSIIRECVLYVTVEPCVMCASLLRQLGIKKVYFGAVNDKFGGTGGVFSIHANSLPVSSEGPSMSAHPQPPPIRLPGRGQILGTSFPPSGGDGGNVEPGYEIEGGWGRDDAVGLLRKFYVQENGRGRLRPRHLWKWASTNCSLLAPVPRKKEGRAARLAALENNENDDENDDASEGIERIDTGFQPRDDPEMLLNNGVEEPDEAEEGPLAAVSETRLLDI